MQEEIFPLVDEKGNVIGQAPRSVCHNGSKLLHPVVHLHIFNPQGEIYLQKRSPLKDIQPDKWDTSVAGHIDLGETIEEAVFREAKEELDIENFKLNYITHYIIETNRERELSYCFYTIYSGHFNPNKDEISDARFWKIEEILNLLTKGVFTTNFESDLINS